MFSMILPDDIKIVSEGVYWTILALFFALAILSWLIIGRNWFQDDTTAPGSNEQTENIPLNNAE